MSLADLVFLCGALTAVSSLVMAALWAVTGERARAWTLLRRLGVGVAVYFAVVIGVSLVAPRREFKLGQPQCYDDWCVAVDAADVKPAEQGSVCTVTLRVSSRARGISQREHDMRLYITDHRGRRFDPVSDRSGAPLDALVGPGQSFFVTRRIQLPADAKGLGVVAAHEGGFPIGWFIIGYDTWFRKPPIVRL